MKYERWIAGWKATESEMRMSKLLNKFLDMTEKLPEEEQSVFLAIVKNHYEGLMHSNSFNCEE